VPVGEEGVYRPCVGYEPERGGGGVQRRIGLLAAMGSMASPVACAKDIDKPTPPDMSALVEAYIAPQGVFDDGSVNDVLDAVADALDALETLGITDQLDAMFTELRDATAEDASAAESTPNQADGPGAAPQGEVETDGRSIRIEGEGFFEVERICDGWGPNPTPDSDNGNLRLNVNVTDLRVDPVVWATTSACRYIQDGVPIVLDAGSRRDVGDLRVFVGNNLAVEDLGTTPIIVDIDVLAGIDPQGGGDSGNIDFDVRINPDTGMIEIRVPIASGDLIVGTSDSTVVSVRGGNGLFACDSGLCINEAGDEVSL
jgi:hypothetical protein